MTDAADIVVIALGSRMRGDDAVGPTIAAALNGRLNGCRVIEGEQDAMAIVNAWSGAALAVIVDAATFGARPGTIHRIETGAQPLPKTLARCSSHGLGLAEAVQLGAALDRMPVRLVVYAIEAQTFQIGVPLSLEVAASTLQVAQDIEDEINALANDRM